MSEKRCPRCKKVLPMIAFHRLNGRKSGRQVYCKPCQRAYNRGERKRPDRKERDAARNRLNRTLAKIRNSSGISRQQKRELRWLAVENSLRRRHRWLDRILKAEEQTDA